MNSVVSSIGLSKENPYHFKYINFYINLNKKQDNCNVIIETSKKIETNKKIRKTSTSSKTSKKSNSIASPVYLEKYLILNLQKSFIIFSNVFF